MDLDSTICEVHGDHKDGAAYGYTHVLGYHPLIATRADTGEVLHARLRKGSSPARRQALRRRAHRPGAPGRGQRSRSRSGPTRGSSPMTLIDTLVRLQVGYSITVQINAQVRACIEAIDESAWLAITYPDGGMAQVAETTYVTGGGVASTRARRLVVRRTRLTDRAPAALWPDWRHHAFVTNVELDTVAADAFHRAHATSSSPSETSKKARASSTAPRGTSSPTPPGWPAPCSPTTSSAGPLASATSIPATSSPWRAACAPGSSPFPVASSIAAAPRLAPPRAMALGASVHQGARSDPGPAARHLSVKQRGPAQPQTHSMR